MKKLHIHGLWLVLQIISTSQGTLNNTNTPDATLTIFTRTPTILKSLDQQTVLMSGSTITVTGKEHTNTRYLQDTSTYSHILTSVFISERTPSQTMRNLFNSTQSKTVRNTFKNTQTFYQTGGGVYVESTAAVGSVQSNRTYVHSSETDQLVNPSAVQFSKTAMAPGDSQLVQYTRGGHSHSLPRSKYISSGDSSHASKSTMVHKPNISATINAFQSRITNINATNAFQSSATETENSSVFLPSITIEVSSSRSHYSRESSSNNRFPPSTQTPRPSRIINSSLSSTGVSETQRLDLKTRLPDTLSRSHINTHQSSTIRTDLKTSKRFHNVTSSSYRDWQFSRHENNSYLAQTVHLSSTTNSVSKSHINTQKISKLVNLKTSKSLDRVGSSTHSGAWFSRHRNDSYLATKVHLSSTTLLNFISKSHVNARESSTLGNLKTSKALDRVASSTYRGAQLSRHGNNSSYLAKTVYLSSTTTNRVPISRIQPTITWTRSQNISESSANKESINNAQSISFSEVVSSATFVSNSEASILGTQKSDYRTKTSRASDEMKVTAKTTDSKSEHVTREPHIHTSHQSPVITTTRHQSSSSTPSMPLYALAICLPVALLCGFTIAFVYFKRNKEDHRVRYSVTVEISSDKPDHELKRMYSVIDVTSGINKDFLTGLESRKASNANILDQLDGESNSAAKPDQTV